MSSPVDTIDRFVTAATVRDVERLHGQLTDALGLRDLVGRVAFFRELKRLLEKKSLEKYSRVTTILTKLEKRSQLKQYSSQALFGKSVLVIGGGISGLRVCLELLLLGAEVVCVEKRQDFSRNNVIHLWPSVIADLRALGAKRFYGQFCFGSIDHVAIRQLQLILVKSALLLGLRLETNTTFRELCSKQTNPSLNECSIGCQCCCHSHSFQEGASAHFETTDSRKPIETLNSKAFHIIVGADGRRNTLFNDFPRQEFRGKLAIAITANFVRNPGSDCSGVKEISGVSYIYAQKWFEDLRKETAIQLENICYYLDETHYFVMTASKASLLHRRVLRKDLFETHALLSADNIDQEALLSYARDAAHWTTGLRGLEFARNGSGAPDVALFDFTSVYAAKNASRAKQIHTRCCVAPDDDDDSASTHVLMLLTGDSLLEPFWPTGSGAGRGFLSALDAAYCAREWALRVLSIDRKEKEKRLNSMIEIIAERESVYRLLAQTTPQNISKDFSLDPKIRYNEWTQSSIAETRKQCRHLIGWKLSLPIVQNKRARRATVAVTARDLKESQQLTQTNVETDVVPNDDQHDTRTTRTTIATKADWLLGSRRETATASTRPMLPKIAIVEKAQELEEKMFSEKKNFFGKLQKVGKIEENDWNVRPWIRKTNNEAFEKRLEDKPIDRKNVSKTILESRKTQIEAKLRDDNRTTRTDDDIKRDTQKTTQWIQRMREELSQRFAPELHVSRTDIRKTEEEEEEQQQSSKSKCVRCGTEVSAVERISVSGDVLHRSCLRCSKCGISLRLNEFRNELRFLCIFCAKSEARNDPKKIRAKELFLSSAESVDFRERAHFQSSSPELQIVSKTAINEKSDSDYEDSPVVPDDGILESSEESSSQLSKETTVSDDDWQTTDDESDVPDDEPLPSFKSESPPPIPSICVTRESAANNLDLNADIALNNAFGDHNDNACSHVTHNNDLIRYSGAFTEKLFRSRSQPMIAFSRRSRRHADDVPDDDTLPFADVCDDATAAFSPLRAVRAPIIDFADI
ncbi:F-actin-monooxygenase mical1-like [Oppia nitens]|uniref:F-actin-monooxygenase mical1-like n=1 Tax=Oppia nitens TaxID=1686743 RepID=UPI0023DADC98|nr:F-actin-monooxygenase mical1-like [Oppia nitens]